MGSKLNISEFEIYEEARLARCRFCKNANPMEFNNARVHATSQKHLAAVRARNKTDDEDYFPEVNYTVRSNRPESSSRISSLETSIPDDVHRNSPNFDPIQEFSDYHGALSAINTPPMNDDSELPLEGLLSEWCDAFEEPAAQEDVEETDCYPASAQFKNSDWKSEWAPYPNKAMFLTDILFNSPRLRFSEAQKRAVLKWGKDLGAQDVPTLYALEKMQKELTESFGDPTSEKRTHKGSIFYINEIGAAISKDLSNPLVRPHLVFYPMVNQDGSISQTWHGKKWLRDLPEELLTPMAIHPDGRHFYVGEICLSRDQTYFIPQKWFIKENNGLWAVGMPATLTPCYAPGSG